MTKKRAKFNVADDEDQQPEMQIGQPTDAKHVAHIGVDGPSVNSNAPSWVIIYNSHYYDFIIN